MGLLFLLIINSIEYFKHKGSDKYKKWNLKYKLVEGRFLDYSKFGFVFGGTYLIGVDNYGYLIIEYGSAKELHFEGKYKTINSFKEQMIFEKVN